MLKLIISLAFFCILTDAYDVHLCRKKLKDNGFIPQYASNISNVELEIIFKYTTGHRAGCGNVLNITTVSKAPFIKADVDFRCKFLTVLMIDVDYEGGSPFLHLLIHNVRATELLDGISTQKEWEGTAANYFMPGPTGSGTYRLLSLLYCQEGYMHQLKKRYWTFDSRKNFDPAQLTKMYKFGKPISASYFSMSYDS